MANHNHEWAVISSELELVGKPEILDPGSFLSPVASIISFLSFCHENNHYNNSSSNDKKIAFVDNLLCIHL